MAKHTLCPLFFILLAALTQVIPADQLAYNSKEECERALKELPPGALLISYCSGCLEPDTIEIQRITTAEVVYTQTAEFYEVVVSFHRLYRSVKPVNGYSFPDDIEYEPVPVEQGKEKKATGRNGIDFAYVYVHLQGDIYVCLGKLLNLYCEVPVVRITLPRSLLDEIDPVEQKTEFIKTVTQQAKERCQNRD